MIGGVWVWKYRRPYDTYRRMDSLIDSLVLFNYLRRLPGPCVVIPARDHVSIMHFHKVDKVRLPRLPEEAHSAANLC